MTPSPSLASAGVQKEERLFSPFETWPDWLFYAPVFAYWLWLSVRYRSLTLPMAANPSIAFGGFIGETKSEALRLLGTFGIEHLAPYALILTADTPEESLARATRAMNEAHLAFPIVAKPDRGKNGTGVRVVPTEAVLADYLSHFPKRAPLILQKYIAEENEAGVFYVRYPSEKRGRVVSLTFKFLPYVVGDGAKTLRELIEADARASRIKELYFKRHGARLDEIVPAGKRVRLVSVGNHCKGAIFKNGTQDITPQLSAAFDRVCREMPDFYFGRFDVRFTDRVAFLRGEDFMILEANGAGAEMTHVWDAQMELKEAWLTLLAQYRTAFEIGNENRKRGVRPAGPVAFIKAWRSELGLLHSYSWEE